MATGGTLLAALLIPAARVEAAYVFQNVDTDRVVYLDTWLEHDEAVVFETANLSSSADTVMHVWDTVDQVEVAYNDNIDGSSLRSRVSVNNTKTARWFGVIVRARDGSTEGTADLYKNGALLAGDGT